jgi:hypothetical protein
MRVAHDQPRRAPEACDGALGHDDFSVTMGVYGHRLESMHEHVTRQHDELYVRTIAAPVEAGDHRVTQLFA